MNISKIFRKKEKETPEDRRSGEDRREMDVPVSAPVSEGKRETKERREVLQGVSKIIETYRKIPLFKGFTNEQLMKMLRICSKIKTPGTHYLFHRGDESTAMYILLKGRINIMLEGGDVWKSLSPFGCVGDMGFFAGTKRSADVITDTECIFLQLSKGEMTKLFTNDKDLHIKILQNIVNELTNRLLSDREEIEHLNYRISAYDTI